MTQTITLQKIDRSEFVEVSTNPNIIGNFYFENPGDFLEWKVIIKRSPGDVKMIGAVDEDDCINALCCELGIMKEEVRTTTSAEPLPAQPADEPPAAGSAQTADDEDDALAIMQAALGGPVEKAEPEANHIPEAGEKVEHNAPVIPPELESAAPAVSETPKETDAADPVNPYSTFNIGELKALIDEQEGFYFKAASVAARLESELKEKQQAFDEANAKLIADKKAAIKLRDSVASRLREVAAEYGKRTDETSYDQYIKFKTFEILELNEPLAMKWAEAEYPNAIIPPSAKKLDVGLIKEHLKYLKKQKQPIPEFAKYTEEVRAEISKTTPIVEGVTIDELLETEEKAQEVAA